MKKRYPYIQKLIRSLHYRSISAVVLLLVMFMASVASLGITSVLADEGDYSIDWIAANPYSYNHLVGGGAYDDRTIGLDGDVVESLEGADFACGDIVTYLAFITIDDPTGTETIELTTRFSANTTGQPGAGHVDIVDDNIAVNYGEIVDLIPGENTVDDGIIDDGGSTATLVDEYFDGGVSIYDDPETNADLVGVIRIDDLDALDTSVVIRVDVRVGCASDYNPTGNLQANLSSARVIDGGAISGGEQTIPFKGLSQILFPGLNLFKSVSLDGACPGEETLTVPTGTTVYYCFRIHNNGEANLLDITLTDDQFGNIIDLLEGFTYINEGTVPDLAPGEYADNSNNPLAHVANQDITNIATANGGGLTDTASCTVDVYSADFGDLPGSYGLTKFSDDGARHSIGNVFLGNVIDSETDGVESDQADGDDYDNEINDEDGIVRPTGSNWSDGSGELLVTVSDYGCLTAWLDFTDGTEFGYNNFFTDTITLDNTTFDELVIENQLLNPGETEVQFNLPLGAANNNALFFARFRLVPALGDSDPYCGDPPALTGFQEGGEVEDYAFIFGPTSITLADFDASSDSGVHAIWLAALALLGIALLGFTITRMLRFNFYDSEK